MVNAKFPVADAYGFEKVHTFQARGDRDSAPLPRHQCKIYGESNDSVFTQNKGSRNTQDLAVAVNENNNGVVTLNTHESTGFEMFFLLRMAFWLCIVLALLPTDKTAETDKSSPVAATDAFSAATAAVSDMTQFCTRQPTACEIGGQAATVVGHRAQAGAKKVYDFITEKKAPEITDKKPETTVAKEVIKDAPVKDFGGRQDIRPGKTKDAKKSQDHTGSIGPMITEKHAPPSEAPSPQDSHLEWQFGWQAPII